MAEQEKIGYLDEITARQLNSWRNGWVFREKSYSQRGHNNMVKAFFKWAIRFDYLEKDPMSKLDAISVIPVPTLPLQNDEYPRMLTAVNFLPSTLQTKVRCHMLLMRWSGLAIRDASCLPVDALSPDNRLRTQGRSHFTFHGSRWVLL
jgi:site-specific recombinase XerD